MYCKNSKGFTLIEILVVLVIMGFLVALVSPKFAGIIEFSSAKLNKTQMQEIKRATLEFYNNIGFVPDNVALLTYSWEKCVVKKTNYDDSDSSDICKNMIAFIDKHYKYYNEGGEIIRENDVGDNGKGTKRKAHLIQIIQEKLDPNNGWKGPYIGANSYIQSKNVKTLGYDGKSGYENNNQYFFSDQDIRLFYEDSWSASTPLNTVDTLWERDSANAKLYPISTPDFNGSQNSASSTRFIQADAWYNIAKYKQTLVGYATILDPYGTPYEIQIPSKSAVGSEARTRYARIVSFGKNRRRDTTINKLFIDYTQESFDDSVLYIFDSNQTSYFYPEDEDK
jgi:prepilin-type N-terminal cleavage/methylation domain-containing protein